MLLFYYAGRYAWLEYLFGTREGEKTGKLPYWGWEEGRGRAGEDQSTLKAGQTF